MTSKEKVETVQDLAMKCKRREIAALRMAKSETLEVHSAYFNGKAAAYADIWEIAAFGKRLHPSTYNEEDECWSKRVTDGDSKGEV